MYIADLHIHSRYSRATSKDCTPEALDLWARRKGISIVGSGDFTHPAWRQELEEKLTPAGNGFYVLKDEYRIQDPLLTDSFRPQFVITGEISSIYKKYNKVRKVHSLILLPGLKDAETISHKLEAIGNIHSDGRPILGLDCHDLLELLLELCPEAIYVPAHIWTPHFSLFGAFSGFDSVEECFGDLSCHIHALETGLSSDPPMNWRVSALDRYHLISNSDAHSPSKLGREANLLDIPLSYEGLREALQTGKGLKGTIEFFPEEGKYHYDGHRKCGICLSPTEAEKYGGICPVCGRKLTIGVSHRIEQMADRAEGYEKEHAALFESLVPLPEIIGASAGYSSASVKVQREYHNMLKKLGPEFQILREIPLDEIRSVSGILISEGIGRLREGKVTRIPGFDGEYGTIRLFTPEELDRLDGQLSLFDGQTALTAPPAGAGSQGLLKPEYPSNLISEAHLHKAASNQDKPDILSSFTEGKEAEIPKKTFINENQRLAIEAIDRVTLVTAGPGTGKTHTLVSHILHLLETRRVKPSCITAVTFTNKAAEEMRERIRKKTGKNAAAKKLTIGTFHSIAWKLLKENGNDASLAGETETKDLAAQLIKTFHLDMTPLSFLNAVSDYKTRPYWTDCRGQSETPNPKLAQAFEAYQDFLREWQLMDFDDILIEALCIARSKSGDCCFSYLLVDEFQDISPLEYQLVKAWNEGGKELFVIGDADQSIYGFRGSDAGCFKRLMEEFPNACPLVLEENYRSTPQILAFASELISKNPGGIRRLQPNRPKGSAVRLVTADSTASQAIFIAKEINRLAGGIGMLEAQEIFPENEGSLRSFDDIAVLYRTHRQAELLETCLKKEGIPYVVSGRDDYLTEPSVRGAIGFFQSLLNPDHKLAGQTALKLLWNLEEGDLTNSIYENMAQKYAPLLKKKKPLKILEEWSEDLHLEKKKAIQKLCQTAVFYSTMADFIEALQFGVESDLKRCNGKKYKSGAVTLMTLHGSKGLEFPAVLIFGVQKGFLPFENENFVSEEEEERRLFYVGVTRAQETLILTASQEESPFLTDFPKELVQREKARPNKNQGNGKQMNLFEFMK